MIDLRTETSRLLAAMLVVGGMLDLFIAIIGGNRSTMSRVFLDAEGNKPVLSGLLSYSLTLFYFHLAYPRQSPPFPFTYGLVYALIACAPVMMMVYLLATGKAESDSGVIRTFMYGDTYMIARTLIGGCLGFLAARYLVPQHV
jgi:hypothetical protein